MISANGTLPETIQFLIRPLQRTGVLDAENDDAITTTFAVKAIYPGSLQQSIGLTQRELHGES